MPAALDYITVDTPMGANLIADGATFRVWAPNAHAVHVCGEFQSFQPDDTNLLTRDALGHWRGFVPGVRDRHRYRFWVVGPGGAGFKRDPYARELATPFPSDSIVRTPDFPWHEIGYRTARFPDFVIYQLHVGAFFTPNLPRKAGTFLDVARKIPHLAALGVTAVQLLPIQEFQTTFSTGYNGTDYTGIGPGSFGGTSAAAPSGTGLNLAGKRLLLPRPGEYFAAHDVRLPRRCRT